MERAQASSVSSPSALPPLSSGLDLTQQLLVIWLCETSEAISEQQLTLWLSYSYPWLVFGLSIPESLRSSRQCTP